MRSAMVSSILTMRIFQSIFVALDELLVHTNVRMALRWPWAGNKPKKESSSMLLSSSI